MSAASNEEDLISEMLSQQQIGYLSSENDEIAVCANCGKEGSNLNICNKCKAVKYCNAACKKKHRSKHKKQCERRVAEMHDEALFREPPPEHGDCPICFLRLPSLGSGRKYMECCGKIVCCGCIYAPVYDNHGIAIVEKKCPFCRTLFLSSIEEGLGRLKKRLELGDEHAFVMIGNAYSLGRFGLPQDSAMAMKFYHQAGKVGYMHIGNAYDNGDGVERDKKMAKHYYELAAMEGIVMARHNLGCLEGQDGNYQRAYKHFMLAARVSPISFDTLKQGYMNGHVAKDHYANALRSHQAYLNEIKSDQRDKAAALHDWCYRYY